MNDRLYRSRSDRRLAGVAGGVAGRFDLDPAVVRILWSILILLSGGIFLLIYIVMAIVVPLEPIAGPGASGWSAAGAGGWSSAWPTSWPETSGPPSDSDAPPPAGSWSPPGSGWPENSGQSSRHAARDARRVARRATRGYGSDRSGTGGIVGGLILVALGAYFLIRTLAPQLEVDRYWPAGLIVLGVILVGLSIRRTPGPGAP